MEASAPKRAILWRMDIASAEEYAHSWIEAWNDRDVDRLADHYAEAVVFRSPFVPRLNEGDECMIRGRDNLRSYFEKGMGAYPHTRIQLHRVGVGVDSVALNYIGLDGMLANEVHVLDGEGKAVDVRIHYSAVV